jgi:curved DNA-binding protein CbpA
MKTPYDLLGIAPNADEKTIAIAFRKAAKHCHPDVNLGDQNTVHRFQQVCAARDALNHPAWRALYQYLHLRRHHDRRQWVVTIASCIISAVVSGGLVSFFQDPPMAAQPIAAGTNTQVDITPPRIGSAVDMVPKENGEPPLHDVATVEYGGAKRCCEQQPKWARRGVPSV